MPSPTGLVAPNPDKRPSHVIYINCLDVDDVGP